MLTDVGSNPTLWSKGEDGSQSQDKSQFESEHPNKLQLFQLGGNNMTDVEFAAYMEMKGYKVHEKTGFNMDAIFDNLNSKPINYSELDRVAEKEGYYYASGIWLKKGVTI